MDGYQLSIQLEAITWNNLDFICKREGTDLESVFKAISKVKSKRKRSLSLAEATVIFVGAYFRAMTKDTV